MNSDPFKAQMSDRAQRIPLRVTTAYALIGILWMLLSHPFLSQWTGDPAVYALLEIINDAVFILATTGLLYWLIRGHVIFLQRTAGALQRSEERYRQLVEQAADGIFVADREGRYLDINSAGCGMLGYTGDEILRLNLHDLLLPEDSSAQPPQLKDLRAGETLITRCRLRCKNGSLLPVEISARVLNDGRLQGIVRDITERKRAEDALRGSEQRYRSLFAAAQRQAQELALLDQVRTALTRELDLTAVFRTVVEAIAQTYGYTLVSLYLLRDEVLVLQHQVGYDRVITEIPVTQGVTGRVVRTGRPVLLDDVRADSNFLGAIEGIVSEVCVPLFDEDRIVGVLNVESSKGMRLSQTDLQLMLALSEHINIALSRARLYTEVRESGQAEREQRALAEALRDTAAALNSTLNLDEVFERILVNLGRIVPHDSANVMLVDAASGVAHITCGRGYAERGIEAALQARRFTLAEAANLREMGETGRPMIIPDIHAYPRWVDVPETKWIRSYAGAPIRVKGQTVGFLNLDSATPNFFTSRYAERLQSFADQAAIAIENARLYESAQRRLAEQIALLSASTVISSSLDLNTVLNRLAEQMVKTIDTTSAYICSWDAPAGTATVLAKYWGPDATPRERESDLGMTYHRVEDVGDDLDRRPLVGAPFVSHVDDPNIPEPSRAHMLKYEGRSALTIPLVVKGASIGYADLWESRRRRNFTSEEIALCQGIAQQAAIALENARLFEAERRRARTLEALHETSLDVSAQLDLPTLLQIMVERAARLLDAPIGGVYLLVPDEQMLEPIVNYGLPNTSTGFRVRLGEGVSGWVAQTGEPLVVGDYSTWPGRLTQFKDVPLRSVVGVPIAWQGQVVGVIVVDDYQANRFSPADVALLSLFANQAAVAIQNARLHDELRRHADELEQRVAERTAELDQERKRLRTILDSAGEAIYFIDTRHTIQYMNSAAERITGFSPVEAVGRRPGDLWRSGLSLTTVTDDLDVSFTRGEMWHGEVIDRRKDGTVYDASLTMSPIKGASGQMIGFVIVQRDITREKELDRLKSQFVSRIGHELRTPLANLKLHLELLERGKPEKRDRYRQILHRETERLRKLIEGFLEMSHLDAGTLPIEPIPTDLNRLAADLVTQQNALALEHGVSLDCPADPTPALAQVDPHLINRAMSIVLENALNYTPRGGRVTLTTSVRAREGRNWATCTVQDTGPGLAPEDLSHLFERFYRGQAARDYITPGAGLGLAVCKAIVDKLGGQITVESRPGQGTAFTIWLKPSTD